MLEPDDSIKLFARWSEPWKIVRRINERNYEVGLKNSKRKIYHVSQLRAWKTPVDFVGAMIVTADLAQNDEDRHLTVLEDTITDHPNFKVETDLPNDYCRY